MSKTTVKKGNPYIDEGERMPFTTGKKSGGKRGNNLPSPQQAHGSTSKGEKRQQMGFKSETCFSRTGAPLSTYDSEEEARSSAEYQNERGEGLNFVPYQCDSCSFWHIRPEKDFVKKLTSVCICTDSSGRAKDAYPSKEEAEKVIALRRKSGVHLKAYPCQYGNGWHLTSHF